MRRCIDGPRHGCARGPQRDVDSIAALYADNARYLSYPFREPDEGIAGARDYLTRTLYEEEDIECWFGEPVTGRNRAAVEWWASWIEDGDEISTNKHLPIQEVRVCPR
jgi:hypothetical protein